MTIIETDKSLKKGPVIRKKGKSEKNSAFMKRCVEDKVMRKEFKNIKQRIAVCLSQKDKGKNKNWKYKKLRLS